MILDLAQSMSSSGLAELASCASSPFMAPLIQPYNHLTPSSLRSSSSSSTPDRTPAPLVIPHISNFSNEGTLDHQNHHIEGEKSDTKRVRRFHRRSKNGCEHCKKRRVRCDEGKPVCGNCVKKGSKSLCVYSWVESQRLESEYPHSSSLHTPDTISSSNLGASFTATAPQTAIVTSRPRVSTPSSHYVATMTASRAPSSISLDPPTMSSIMTEPVPLTVPNQPAFHRITNEAACIYPLNPMTPIHAGATDGLQEIFQFPDNSDTGPPTPPYSPGTEDMLNLLFGAPRTPPLPHLTWPDESDFSSSGAFLDNGGSQQYEQINGTQQSNLSEDTISKVLNPRSALLSATSGATHEAFAAEVYRKSFISNAILRQAYILQQPNELATYFPSIEQRSQFCHFFYETSNDLVVVPIAHAVNPWVAHLSHLALGKAAGHEVLHDAFRYGLLSLASYDMGLKMRRGLKSPGYNAMYATSIEQRDTAMRLLQVAKSLKLYVYDATGADLVLATVAALAIRDRLAGEQDFQPPLKMGVSVIMDQGGPAAFIASSDTAVRRFLVEQMACLELLGVLTSWDPPRLLVGEMKWFDKSSSALSMLISMKKSLIRAVPSNEDHLVEVYGWERQTIMFTAEIMTMTDEIKELSNMRITYRKTSYPAIKSALNGRIAHLEAQYNILTRKAAEIRRKISNTPLHPRVALGSDIQHACMDLLLVGPPDDDALLPTAYAKTRTIMDLCERSISQGMYAGMLLPLTWAASCLAPQDHMRLQGLLRALKPHYHLDPAFMDVLVEMNWPDMVSLDCEKWEQIMRDKGFYAPFF